MSRYSNPALAFECDIPPGWTSLPAAWARKLKLSASASSEKVAALLYDNHDVPFLSLYLADYDAAESIPMVQCTVRPTVVIEQMGGLSALLDTMLAEMTAAYPDFQLLQRDDTCLVAGVRGAYMRASMSVFNDTRQRYACISEFYLLETTRHCFFLGLSGPAADAKRPVADFHAILRSIRIV